MAVTLDQYANRARITDPAQGGDREPTLESIQENLLEQAKSTVQTAAAEMERVLTEAVDTGKFTLAEIFDESYQPIPDTKPQKFHTRYDRYLDETIQAYEDGLLTDKHVTFAVLVDRNGYLPTHNGKFSRPLTGDREQDRKWNRTKRLFNDPVGLAAARNTDDILVQVYNRDTGEKMWDISVPVNVQGKHWGAFRIGYSM